jgi:hypothetical protein
MKDGISAIKEGESHQKLLRKFVKAKFLMSPDHIVEPCVFTFCNDECCDYIQNVQDQFIKNKQLPQSIDVKYL